MSDGGARGPDEGGHAFLADALAERDADAVVHVGRGDDPTLRYLVQSAGGAAWRPPDRTCAFVFTDARTWLCVPDGVEPRVGTPEHLTVRPFPHDRHAGECAASILAETDVGGPVLVPPHVPHDAALYLEQAGFDLASTRAVASARAVKGDGEIDRLRAVQRAAVAGMVRAGDVLAAAESETGECETAESEMSKDETAESETGECETVEHADRGLAWQGEPLTAARLRREINATLAGHGVSDAGNTRVDGPLRPGATVHVELAPRGSRGYSGALGRTFVIDGEGGWERRAHVAVTSARRVALAELEPDTAASWVREETIAELGSFGFTVGGPDGGALPEAGGGIGLARHERPAFRRDTDLEPGHVVTVAPGVRHEEHGTVRTVDVAVVTADGAEWLVDAPTSLSPGAYEVQESDE